MSGLLNSLKNFAGGSKILGEDTNMRFSPTPVPGDSGFNQWRDAMKMVAKLPGGIPPEFRKKLWLALAEKHLQSKGVNWNQTERFCFNEWSNPDDSELGIQIVKDLHRTGCSLFCGAAGQENQALLKRVLLAYARWNKQVGYCQGFNMLAALILQVMDRSESDSVKVMIYLIEGVLPESYFANNLRGLSVDMVVFRDLLKMRLPQLSKHLEALQNDAREGNSYEPPLTNVFTMQWFLTLFCNCLPQSTVLRVWDLIFLEGNEILLRTAIAIWEKLSDRILAVNSADEFYSIMGVLTREMLEFGLVDSNTLVKSIVAIGACAELNDMRDRYLYNITPWTQSVQTAARKGFKLFYSDDDDMESDNDEKAAVTAAYGMSIGRRKERNMSGSGTNLIQPYAHGHPDRERLALDISALKKQYSRLRERQRQAHIILQAACARQPIGPNPTPPIAMNHLLLGKNAIVNSRGRRLGPPKGAIPPARKMEPMRKNSQGETVHWKDTAKIRYPRRQSSIIDETVDIKEDQAGSDSSSSYSDDDDDASSTSTELCDEPDRLDDFDGDDKPSKQMKNARNSDNKKCTTNEEEQKISKVIDNEFWHSEKTVDNVGDLKSSVSIDSDKNFTSNINLEEFNSNLVVESNADDLISGKSEENTYNLVYKIEMSTSNQTDNGRGNSLTGNNCDISEIKEENDDMFQLLDDRQVTNSQFFNHFSDNNSTIRNQCVRTTNQILNEAKPEDSSDLINIDYSSKTNNENTSINETSSAQFYAENQENQINVKNSPEINEDPVQFTNKNEFQHLLSPSEHKINNSSSTEDQNDNVSVELIMANENNADTSNFFNFTNEIHENIEDIQPNVLEESQNIFTTENCLSVETRNIKSAETHRNEVDDSEETEDLVFSPKHQINLLNFDETAEEIRQISYSSDLLDTIFQETTSKNEEINSSSVIEENLSKDTIEKRQTIQPAQVLNLQSEENPPNDPIITEDNYDFDSFLQERVKILKKASTPSPEEEYNWKTNEERLVRHKSYEDTTDSCINKTLFKQTSFDVSKWTTSYQFQNDKTDAIIEETVVKTDEIDLIELTQGNNEDSMQNYVDVFEDEEVSSKITLNESKLKIDKIEVNTDEDIKIEEQNFKDLYLKNKTSIEEEINTTVNIIHSKRYSDEDATSKIILNEPKLKIDKIELNTDEDIKIEEQNSKDLFLKNSTTIEEEINNTDNDNKTSVSSVKNEEIEEFKTKISNIKIDLDKFEETSKILDNFMKEEICTISISPKRSNEETNIKIDIKLFEDSSNLEQFPKDFVLRQQSVELLTVEDKRLEAGRRNSERALKIIQENSLILHRILQHQSRSSEVEDSEDELSKSPISKTFLHSESLISRTDEDRSNDDEDIESGTESYSISPAILDEDLDRSPRKDVDTSEKLTSLSEELSRENFQLRYDLKSPKPDKLGSTETLVSLSEEFLGENKRNNTRESKIDSNLEYRYSLSPEEVSSKKYSSKEDKNTEDEVSNITTDSYCSPSKSKYLTTDDGRKEFGVYGRFKSFQEDEPISLHSFQSSTDDKRKRAISFDSNDFDVSKYSPSKFRERYRSTESPIDESSNLNEYKYNSSSIEDSSEFKYRLSDTDSTSDYKYSYSKSLKNETTTESSSEYSKEFKPVNSLGSEYKYPSENLDRFKISSEDSESCKNDYQSSDYKLRSTQIPDVGSINKKEEIDLFAKDTDKKYEFSDAPKEDLVLSKYKEDFGHRYKSEDVSFEDSFKERDLKEVSYRDKYLSSNIDETSEDLFSKRLPSSVLDSKDTYLSSGHRDTFKTLRDYKSEDYSEIYTKKKDKSDELKERFSSSAHAEEITKSLDKFPSGLLSSKLNLEDKEEAVVRDDRYLSSKKILEDSVYKKDILDLIPTRLESSRIETTNLSSSEKYRSFKYEDSFEERQEKRSAANEENYSFFDKEETLSRKYDKDIDDNKLTNLSLDLSPRYRRQQYSPEISPPKHLSCLQFTTFQTDIPCTSKTLQISPICNKDRSPMSPNKSDGTSKYLFSLPTLTPPRRTLKSPLSPDKTFNPFPVQPTTRQPKDVGIRLGLYKDLSPLKSPNAK